MEIKNSESFILFIALSVAALFQLVHYWNLFSRLAFFNKKPVAAGLQPVSVIICAKNEILNLRKNLVSVLEQDYPDYEVIVVNDCSWDETGQYLEELAKKYSHLKIVTIVEQEKYRHGKKFALTLGIKAAKNELLLMTDADCLVNSKDWCKLMQSHFNEGTDIVLGYGSYAKTKGFLNKLIRFDTFYIAMNYFSSAIGGKAYMGVGRNLAYRRSLFFKSKGFAKHNHLFSGDDDLFVNANSNRSNTAIEIQPDAFSVSEPKSTFHDWQVQKIRHMSTASQYRFVDKFRLFIIPFGGIVFYGALIALLVLQFDWRILLSLYGGVLLLKLPILWRNMSRLREKDLFWIFPILEPVHLFLQPIFYTSNLFTKQKAWK